MIAEKIFLSIFIFSFFGWFYESFLCTSYHRRPFINKGFLLGPYCPIYGIGATACMILFGETADTLRLFLSSALFCGVLEYMTGYSLEKLFHEKWWDYSNCRFQLHGRVSLYGIVSFGAANVIICRLIAPSMNRLMDLAGPFLLSALSFLLMDVFLIDFVVTLIYRKNLNKIICRRYEKIRLEIDRRMKNASEFLTQKEVPHFAFGMPFHRKP